MVVATNNENKLKELKDILNIKLMSLKECNIDIDVIEDQDTFEGNALKKAKEIYNVTKIPCIADDSGLCLKKYNGWPGVMSNRFLGNNAANEEKNIAIINKVNELDNKDACIVYSLAYYDGTNLLVVTEKLEGKIAVSRKGFNGFGFDEIFETKEGLTLAQLSFKKK